MSIDRLLEKKTVTGEDDSIRYCYLSEPCDGQHSGDFNGVKKLKDGRTLFYVGDVSGHGEETISNCAKNLKGIMEYVADSMKDLKTSDIARILNATPFPQNNMFGELHATAFIAIYDPEKRTINYTNAGHGPFPLYFPDTKNPEESFSLQSENAFLGMALDHEFNDYTIILKNSNDSRLVMITDGITERKNVQKEQFGNERFTSTLKNNIHRPEGELVRSVFSDSYNFGLPKQEFEDDISLMALTIKQ